MDFIYLLPVQWRKYTPGTFSVQSIVLRTLKDMEKNKVDLCPHGAYKLDRKVNYIEVTIITIRYDRYTKIVIAAQEREFPLYLGKKYKENVLGKHKVAELHIEMTRFGWNLECVRE